MITSWREMPISVFQKIWDIQSLHITEDEKIMKITALLAGIPEEEFLAMPLIDAREYIAQTHFMYTEPHTHRPNKVYNIGHHRYRLMRSVEGMTTAQYINYQAIVGRPVNEIIADLMAIVLVPDGKTYGDYSTEEVVEELRENLNIEDALSIANFFIHSFEKSMRRMLRFSDGMMMAAKIMAKKEEREMMAALQLEMKLVTDALRSEFGFRW